jgi:hypothetical protein
MTPRTRITLALFALLAPLTALAAITSLDGVVAGMRPPLEVLKVGAIMEAVGVRHSFFYTTGAPGAAAAPSPGINGAALTTYAGQVPFTNPVSGNTYLARFSAAASVAGRVFLYDRLWHNSGIAVATTTLQAITTPTWPARDVDGSTNGVGVMCAIEVSTATTNAGAIANTTLNYTDQSGNTGNVATITSFPATAVAGTFVPFQLASGDTGIRAITAASGGGITLGTSYGGGAIHLVCYRFIAELELPIANTGNAVDAITSGFPRLYDNTVPFLVWLPTATTAVTVSGAIVFTQG